MIAATQRAARVHGPRDLRIDEVPVPTPGPGEVLVRVHRVGICGSDVHFYEQGRIGPTSIVEPLTMGHEPAGVVVDRGPGATRLEVGARVSLEPGVPCGRCRECRGGRYNLCPEIEFFAFPPTGGALTEYVVIHEDFAHPVPDGMSDDAAALIEPLAVALWALRRAAVGPGTAVTVTGAGPIGLLCAQLAQVAGADVTVSDPRPLALETAARFGARRLVRAGAEELPAAEVLFECSGSPAAVMAGIESLVPRGTAVLVGIAPDPVGVPLTIMRRRELTVTSSFRYAGVYPTAIDLVARGLVDLDGLITDRYCLDGVPEAFARATDPSVPSTTIKAIVEIA